MLQKDKKGKEKDRAVDVSNNRQTERTPQKLFRCGSGDHMIAKCPKLPKDNEKRRKQVRFNEKGNCECHNGKNNSYQKIYASMVQMSGNDECTGKIFGDSSQLSNCIQE